MPGLAGGRPGLRRLLVPYFPAASLRCQASSVAGVTGKTSAQRPRGTSRASAASQARSAGSYRTRPAGRFTDAAARMTDVLLSITSRHRAHALSAAGKVNRTVCGITLWARATRYVEQQW